MAGSSILVTGPARGLVGGQARHLEILALVAASLDFDMVRIEIGQRAQEQCATPWPLPLARLLRLMRDYRTYAGALREAAAGNAPVVVHVNTSVQYASLLRDLVFVVIGRLLRVAYVVAQVHGCELTGPSDTRLLLRLLARTMAVSAHRLVVLNRSQAAAIGGAARTALVIPNAICLGRPISRVPLLGDRQPLRLLFLARLIPQKGVLLCLEAARLLRDSGVPVTLTMAGDGPLLAELPRRVATLGLQTQVSVMGAVHPEQVRPLLAVHDLLWAPSTYAEGQPYALIEALEAGLPVLACVPNQAMKEFVAASDGAVLPVEPDPDALAAATRSLAAAPEALAQLQALARRTAETRYSLEASLPLWRTAWARRAQERPGTQRQVAPSGGTSNDRAEQP